MTEIPGSPEPTVEKALGVEITEADRERLKRELAATAAAEAQAIESSRGVRIGDHADATNN